MKKEISKTEAKERIDSFFAKDNFSPDELKKIKRLSMKYKIKLGDYRKSFCKKCLFPLKGEIKISKSSKSIKCAKCGFITKYKLVG